MNLSRLTIILLVGVGAAIGANARYWLGLWVAERIGTGFPYGTLLINVLGSLGIGLFLGLVGMPNEPSAAWRLLIVTGFLGGFTTFSSFSYETLTLMTQNRWLDATVYSSASVGLGLAATAIGVWLVQH